QAEDGIRDYKVTGVQTCALPIYIREHGSGSTGATNVLRTLGKWPALAVLVADLLKGAAAVALARGFYPWLLTLPSVTPPRGFDQIGRASCRERVEMSGVGVASER